MDTECGLPRAPRSAGAAAPHVTASGTGRPRRLPLFLLQTQAWAAGHGQGPRTRGLQAPGGAGQECTGHQLPNPCGQRASADGPRPLRGGARACGGEGPRLEGAGEAGARGASLFALLRLLKFCSLLRITALLSSCSLFKKPSTTGRDQEDIQQGSHRGLVLRSHWPAGASAAAAARGRAGAGRGQGGERVLTTRPGSAWRFKPQGAGPSDLSDRKGTETQQESPGSPAPGPTATTLREREQEPPSPWRWAREEQASTSSGAVLLGGWR